MKIEALQLSWLKRIYDQNEHQSKQIPKYFIKKYYRTYFIQISMLILLVICHPFIMWSKIARSEPVTASAIYTHRIWLNFYLKIEDKSYLSKNFGQACIKFVKDVFTKNGIFSKM